METLRIAYLSGINSFWANDTGEDKEQLTASPPHICTASLELRNESANGSHYQQVQERFEEDEEDIADEEEHDNFMRKFLLSGHCTVCIYLSLSLLMIGCVVALVVISVQVRIT